MDHVPLRYSHQVSTFTLQVSHVLVEKKKLTTVSQCPIWSRHLDRAGTQNAQIQDTRRLSLFFIHMGGKEGQSIHTKDMYIHRTLSSILLYRWGVRESP